MASILVTAVPATFLLVSLIMWFIVLAAYNTNNKKQEVEVRHVHYSGSYIQGLHLNESNIVKN